MSEQAIRVPELGGADSVEIVGVLVSVGDSVNAEDPLLELESDKATVELPAPADGTVTRLDVKEGDSLKEGDLVGMMETAESGASGDGDVQEDWESEGTGAARDEQETSDGGSGQTQSTHDSGASGGEQPIQVPELGGADSVEIVGVLVGVGDSVNAEDPLLELESDKATVELPSPATGRITRLDVEQGDTLKEGDVVGALEVAGSGAQDSGDDDRQPETERRTHASAVSPGRDDQSGEQQESVGAHPASYKKDTDAAAASDSASDSLVHAGPAVRKIARQFGVALTEVRGSGPKGRILKEDVQDWVKRQLESGGTQAPAGGGMGIPGVELPDFSQFGEIERRPMNKIQKLTAQGMERSWLNVPHVTQFEDADITDLEAFRQARKAEGESRGVKLTFVPFLLKACAYALRRYPQFNVSLDMANEAFIQKHYCHIGVAVDTPKGLVVPVVRDVDSKSIWQLAEELQTLAGKARDGKLTNDDMSGACFTITSLGGIGGTAFTPIVNTPEVAILGVSKASTQPVWDGEQFQPRLMAPLSLSYDHRAINGADAARFTTLLSRLLGDLRELVM